MTVLPHPAIRTPTIVEPVCILTKSAILTRVRSAFVNIWNCIKTKHTSLSRRNRLGHYTDRSIDKPVLTEFTVLSFPAIRAFTGVGAIDVMADAASLTREGRTLVHIWPKDVHSFNFLRIYRFVKCRRCYLAEILQILRKTPKNQSEGQICPYRHRSACRSSQRRSYTGKNRGCSGRCPRGDRESDHTHPHLTKKSVAS